MMTLNRKYRHISLNGNSVAFEKDVPSFVPPNLVAHMLGVGGAFVTDEDDQRFNPNTAPEPVIPTTPVGDERATQITKMMAAMVERNERDDFTGSGLPSKHVLEKLLGFDVDTKERNILWTAYDEARRGDG